MPTAVPQPGIRIAMSLSGGGVRSMMFCLGALRAVVEALERENGRLAASSQHRLTDIASVSGGSIGLAYASTRLPSDLTTVTGVMFDESVLGPAYRLLTSQSIMWGAWPFRLVFLVLGAIIACAFGLLVPGPLIVIVVAPVVGALALGYLVWVAFAAGYGRARALAGLGFVLFAVGIAFITAFASQEADLSLGLRVLGVMGSIALLVSVFRLRGWALEEGMKAALFPSRLFPQGGPTLAGVSSSAKLVITATDLNAGQAIFLTPDGIQSSKWGVAPANAVSLVRAARASATFPGVFPALFLGRSLNWKPWRHSPKVPDRVALVDGGIYDNMGTEWLIEHTPNDAYLVIVNASGNLTTKRSGFGLFGLGEWQVISRNQRIQYDAATAPRRRWLMAMFRQSARTGITNEDSRRGTIIRIDGNVVKWLQSFADTPVDDERRQRAAKTLTQLTQENPNFDWPALARANTRVATSLDRLSPTKAKSLARAGYLSTAVQLHVLEGWPAPRKLAFDSLLDSVLRG